MKKILMLLLGVFIALTQLLAQTRTITGRVTDDSGNPVQNASVVVKGSTTGTTTNEQGDFTLSIPSGARTIIVSNIGMVEREIDITSSNNYSITLSAKTAELQEVVVSGYGTQRRANITSSIATVKAVDIENRPFTSVDQMLAGKIPGLQAPVSTGQTGAAQPIRIRGIGSVSAGASP